MQQSRPAPADGEHPKHSGYVFLTGAILALFSGIIDVIISMMSEQPAAFSSFTFGLLPVLATSLLMFGFFVIVRGLVGLILRSGRVDPVQTSVTLAVLWGVLFILARLGNLLKTSLAFPDLIKAVLLIVLGVYTVHLILHRTGLIKWKLLG